MAVLARAGGRKDAERSARPKGAWFRQLLALPRGIPSDDPSGRVFS